MPCATTSFCNPVNRRPSHALHLVGGDPYTTFLTPEIQEMLFTKFLQDAWSRNLAKTVTWRIVGTVDSFFTRVAGIWGCKNRGGHRRTRGPHENGSILLPRTGLAQPCAPRPEATSAYTEDGTLQDESSVRARGRGDACSAGSGGAV
jgi:hypothetical protein